MKDKKECIIPLLVIFILAIASLYYMQSEKKRELEYLLKRYEAEQCEKAGGVIFQEKCVDKSVFIEVGK